MKVKHILESNRDYIIESYKNGGTTTKIGKELGVNGGSIYAFLQKDCGIKMRKQKKLEDYKDDILKLYDEGQTLYGITKSLNLNHSTCHRYCKKLGLDFSKNLKTRDVLLKDQEDEIISDYKAGMGCYKLSKKYKCAESSILRLLRGHGIEALYINKYDIPHKFQNVSPS